MPEAFQLTDLQRRVQNIEARVEDLPALRERSNSSISSVHDLDEEVRALRRAIVTAAVSFAASAVLIAVSVLIAIR